jgi:hypothetical protein
MQRKKYKKHKRPGSSGSNHWNWSNRECSNRARQERADTNCRLRYLCDMAIHGGFMSQPTKFIGRPPKDYIKPDFNNLWSWVYMFMKIDRNL